MNRLKIEKYQEDDFESYFDVVKEDKVMKFISGVGLTRAQAQLRFGNLIQLNLDQEILGYFKVVDGENHIGSCKLEHYKKDPSVLEVGYILKEAFWGKGYGTKICKQMLDLANQVNPNTNIIGIIDPENTGSRKVLEKFGFETYFVGMEDEKPTEKLILRKTN